MSVPLGWAMKFWDQFCYMAASCSAVLGSLTAQEVVFPWRDFSVVIDMGMPERTIGVSMPHVGVRSRLAQELRGFVALLTSDGEECRRVPCGHLAQHILSLGSHPSIHFLVGNTGRGFGYGIQNALSWKTT